MQILVFAVIFKSDSILNMNALMQKAQFLTLGKNPVVIFPVAAWDTMRERFDALEEYYKMSTSKKYKKDIATARISKKEVSSKNLYKKLGLV